MKQVLPLTLSDAEPPLNGGVSDGTVWLHFYCGIIAFLEQLVLQMHKGAREPRDHGLMGPC